LRVKYIARIPDFHAFVEKKIYDSAGHVGLLNIIFSFTARTKNRAVSQFDKASTTIGHRTQ